ncbi:MAG: DUF4301 family protein, partial [Rikenellaceae bacterium]
MFTQTDLSQISDHGLTPEAVELQVENFKKGFPYLKISRAATCGDGITQLSEAQIAEMVALYEGSLSGKEVVKFVPA